MTRQKRQYRKTKRRNIALSLLDRMIIKYFKTLSQDNDKNPKLGDWLKMIELRRKLQPDEKPHEELWKKLEQVRKEMLDGNKSETRKTCSETAGKEKNAHTSISSKAG